MIGKKPRIDDQHVPFPPADRVTLSSAFAIRRMISPIHIDDTLDVGIRVSRLGNSSVSYEIGIFCQGQEKPAATGHFVHVYVRHGEMTPVAIPDKARAALERILVEG